MILKICVKTTMHRCLCWLYSAYLLIFYHFLLMLYYAFFYEGSDWCCVELHAEHYSIIVLIRTERRRNPIWIE